MNPSLPVVFTAELQRKNPRLPVFVVVPWACLAHWKLEATATVEGTLNGVDFGRRSIKRMDVSGHSDWFVEYTAPICQAAGVAVGDTLSVVLRLASSENPQELEALLANDPRVRAYWDALSAYTRRTQAEHIRAGKTEATRLRRAQTLLTQIKAAPGF